MAGELIGYWQYDRLAELTCPSCGWSGPGAEHEEYFRELLDVRCPQCDTMLLIVSYPTNAETRAAAAAGNEIAAAELPSVHRREKRWTRARELKLTDPASLPRLALHRSVEIEWDLLETDGEHWTVLRCGARELWRELAFWEGYERFAEVFVILRRRYGRRLARVTPTPGAEVYLYGDRLSAPQVIDGLNASLRDSD